MKQHVIFDTEIIGSENPVFLTCTKIVETGETRSFWHHKRGHTARLEKMVARKDLTWVGFNSENFDRPLIAAAVMGHDETNLSQIAHAIINDDLRSWMTYRQFQLDFLEYDHIDLMEVAPGVMISLKTYAGRMSYPSMIDLPFPHDQDLTPAQQKVLERYCLNDLGVTEALFNKLRERIDLRERLGDKYDLDLRSKSDAQCAEAILKKVCGIASGDKSVPTFVTYKAPAFIKTDSQRINDLLGEVEALHFHINRGNGSPEFPELLAEEISIGSGTYQMGLGGLHSTHDKAFYARATDDWYISDFDVASYYPNIMLKAGLGPRLPGNKRQLFIDTYRDIYNQRIEAKRAGHKIEDKSLKILLNGTFGKLGSIYCAFYSPDLMLAITLTGQFNLLCLIHDLEKTRGVKVLSANTDGIMVGYPVDKRDMVLKKIATNARCTGFDYEETPYAVVAMKDVNNYIAFPSVRQAVIIEHGKIKEHPHKMDAKTKGLYASSGVEEMKNPTMEVCSRLAQDYLDIGVSPENGIKKYQEPWMYMAVRNVKGGGIQHVDYLTVDDWEELERGLWRSPSTDKTVKRVSRPAPFHRGVGGEPFGRVARWYMTTERLPPITYVSNGNQVPKTEGAKLCLTLPDKLPADLDLAWYIKETKLMLGAMGVPEFAQNV